MQQKDFPGPLWPHQAIKLQVHVRMLICSYINNISQCHKLFLHALNMSKYLCQNQQCKFTCVSVCFVRVCLYMHVEESVFCLKRGAQRGAPISCVQVAVFEGWQGGGLRTCRACVWEPRAPHFSYIVLLLLQTVNATKDAQPIVARDS